MVCFFGATFFVLFKESDLKFSNKNSECRRNGVEEKVKFIIFRKLSPVCLSECTVRETSLESYIVKHLSLEFLPSLQTVHFRFWKPV